MDEFGKDFFDAQEGLVRSWLREIGMARFDDVDSSTDAGDRGEGEGESMFIVVL